MPINKVVFGNQTLIDISDTTATANDVVSGKYFYTANGTKTVGTIESGGDNPNHMELGKELVLECGNHNIIESGSTKTPVFQLTGSVAPTARRTLYAASGDVRANCYYTASGKGTVSNAYLIPIPTGATSVTLTMDKTCQLAPRDYVVSNGAVQSGTSAAAYVNITANTPTTVEWTSGSTHLSFAFRVDANNTNYNSSNMPTSIALDFVTDSGGGQTENVSLFANLGAKGTAMVVTGTNSFTVSGMSTNWSQYIQTIGSTYHLEDLVGKDLTFKIRLSDASKVSGLSACFAVTSASTTSTSSSRVAYGPNFLTSATDDGTGLFTYSVNFNDLTSKIVQQATTNPNYYLKVFIYLNSSTSISLTCTDIVYYMEVSE